MPKREPDVSRPARFGKLVLVEFHVHARAAECDSFHLQTESLLRGGLPRAFNCAA